MGFPGGTVVKNPPANAKGARDTGSIPGLGRSGRGNGNLGAPEFLPVKFHKQRSLEVYSPCSCKELDTVEWLSTHT